MTRGEMRTELQQGGFGATAAEVVRMNNWINQAYLWVWYARDPGGVLIDWSFKKVDQGSLSVTAGDATPSMPADFDQVDYILDDLGWQLAELAPEKFDGIYGPMAALGQSSQRPESYKVVNRQVTFGPTPGVTATYKWSYDRRPSHYDGSSVLTAGTFTADDDTPLWPDHHMILVHAAALIGHAQNSNPFASIHAQLRDDALQAMRADLEHEFAPAQVWGDGGWSGYSYGL